MLVGGSDRDVAEPAEVAEGELAAGVDLVAADAVVDGRWRLSGSGLDAGVEGGGWGLAGQGSVGAAGVVVEAESVELGLELDQGGSRGLLGEEALEGLVEAFDLPAGLGLSG